MKYIKSSVNISVMLLLKLFINIMQPCGEQENLVVAFFMEIQQMS